jgi:hypothetical protein
MRGSWKTIVSFFLQANGTRFRLHRLQTTEYKTTIGSCELYVDLRKGE